jgi:hypothetical protein
VLLDQQRDKKNEERSTDCNNLGTFYRYINKHYGNKADIGTIIDAEKILNSDTDKVNTFNSHFSLVGLGR